MARTPPFGNMPVQLPCPFCTKISNTSVPPAELGLSWLSELLIFDTKNLGIGVESEQMATLRARFGDGDNAKVLGKLEDVKGTTVFRLSVVRVCANASVAESRHSRASGSIEQAASSSSLRRRREQQSTHYLIWTHVESKSQHGTGLLLPP